MTTIGAEIPETTTEGGVILGVDTHLDFHVAVVVDHLGRRLGESSVPTTVRLRESPVLGAGFWAREVSRGRRYQQLRSRIRTPPEGPGDLGGGGRDA